jgi:Domain of unknown function (DUF927)
MEDQMSTSADTALRPVNVVAPVIKPFARKVANLEDEATGDGFDVYEFSKPLGEVGCLLVARDKANDARPLHAALAAKNWNAEGADTKAILEACIKQAPPEYRLAAAHVGWRSEQTAFVLHERVVGTEAGEKRLVPPHWLGKGDLAALKHVGSLDRWIEEVADPCRFSTRLMFALSCAFAAPLVKIMGMQSFGAMLFASAKVGKSTALVVGASVIGLGTESALPNFNTTDASFYERARSFNDLLYAVNEVGLADKKKASIYSVLRERVYGYAEGRDTSRHSGSGFASASSSATWRGVLLGSSEHSCEALARMAGQDRDAGEYARVFDVPVVDEGLTSVIDRVPNEVAADEIAAWSRQQLGDLRKACAANHGVAIEPYLVHLMEAGASLPDSITAYMQAFANKLNLQSSDEALVHAARNFSLIYAGACLAIDARLLPWRRQETLDAIVACFEAGMGELKVWEAVRRRASKLLISSLKAARLKNRRHSDFDPSTDPGFYEKVHGSPVITLRAATMRRWFPDDEQYRAALEWLDETGRLIKANAEPRPAGLSGEWAVTSPRWSEGKKVKSIRFYNKPPRH